jgi:hypothetical protein
MPDGQITGSKKLRELVKNWPAMNSKGHVRMLRSDTISNIFRKTSVGFIILLLSHQIIQ